MLIPPDIDRIIAILETSEKKWKAKIAVVWQHSYELKKYENTKQWREEGITLHLPFAKTKPKISPMELHGIYISLDEDFTYGHLQSLFTFFEVLITLTCPILYGEETPIDASDFGQMLHFLKADTRQFNGIEFISDREENELNLAKKTRNCHIHDGGKIEEKFLVAYGKVFGERLKLRLKEGDNVSTAFSNIYHEVEDWQHLILKITTKIKSEIQKK